MKPLLVVIALFAAGRACYHETIGVPAAERIWTLEQSLDSSARITNGLHSFKALHPFFGGLIISLASNLTSVCGSSLLTNTKLVTAAHCWFDGENQATELTVVLGSVRLFSGGTRIVTDKVEMHEGFSPTTVQNDLAIITVPTVTFSVYIKPIKLPEGTLLKNNYEGWNAAVVGYGRTGDSVGIHINQSLRFGVVTVKNNKACKMYGESFGASMICTNGIFFGPCGGDSGGPLFINDREFKKYLIGVVSYGSVYGCEAGHPTVYTRISSYVDWINARI